MKLLLIDDEPDILEALEVFLQDKGFDVHCSANSLEAWQLLNPASGCAKTFDVLFTDNKMPQMSGIELVQKVRNAGLDITIVMMSGDGLNEHHSIVKKEVYRWLTKPFNMQELTQVFEEISLRHQPASTNQKPQDKMPITNSQLESILIIDDEPDIRAVIAQLLHDEHYHTEQAIDGEDGLCKIQQAIDAGQSFDLIITDLRMPRMNGAQMLKQLHMHNCNLPVIVLTGHAELDEAYSLLQDFQITDFLFKPLQNARPLLFAVRNGLEKKRLQAALECANNNYQQLNNQLEEKVAQQTASLKEQTQKAIQANQAKSEFLSRMSHEMRTPLNGMLGLTQVQELQLKNQNYEQAMDNINVILQSGRHLLCLIDDTLDIERIEQGTIEIDLIPCDLDAVARQSIDILKKQADTAKVTVEYVDCAITLLADPARLLQILVNLLSNGIKFNHPGGNVIIKAQPQHNGTVMISVTDTGVGIDPAEFSTLFEPFTRLKYADEHQIDGIGNGLTVSKMLAQQMGGQLDVNSQIGRGSVFKLILQQTAG